MHLHNAWGGYGSWRQIYEAIHGVSGRIGMSSLPGPNLEAKSHMRDSEAPMHGQFDVLDETASKHLPVPGAYQRYPINRLSWYWSHF